MPTYDYVCDLCAHAFEHFQGMSEPLLTECPRCGKRGLRRLIGAGAGLLFKGSGFYETDYKRKPETSTAASKSPAGSGSDSSPDKGGAGGSGTGGDAPGGDTSGGNKPGDTTRSKPDAKAGDRTGGRADAPTGGKPPGSSDTQAPSGKST